MLIIKFYLYKPFVLLNPPGHYTIESSGHYYFYDQI